MAYGRTRRRFKRSFNRGTGKVKQMLTRAKSSARNNKKKVATMTTVVMALGAYLAYDKFLKK